MNVMLVSQCGKQALPATRRILDQFAERKGMRTWLTPITEAGLETLHGLLRRGARRNTAVACHLIRGSDIELLWIVGNRRHFDRRGNVPTDTSSRSVLDRYKEDGWRNAESIALLAALAGLFHDFGKASELFQAKLDGSRSTSFEPWRHEWLSVRLFQAFVGESSDSVWLERLCELTAEGWQPSPAAVIEDRLDKHRRNPLKQLRDRPVACAVAWLICTHHRLPVPRRQEDGTQYRLSGGDASNWLDCFSAGWITPPRPESASEEEWEALWRYPGGLPSESGTWRKRAAVVARRAIGHTELSSEDWLAQPFVMHLARCALMLADHHYSAGPATAKWQDDDYSCHANTEWAEHSGGRRTRVPKQRLDEHCIGVSHQAYFIARSLPRLRSVLPAIGDIKPLRKRSGGRFAWQNKAFSLAEQTADATREQGGFFVNMASTGTGKTLANARMAFGLSASDEGCRFTVLLGLRTLTLQTGDALRQRIGLSSGDIAVLVGSAAVRELHERSRQETEAIEADERDSGSESARTLFAEHEYIRYDGQLDDTRIGQWLRGNREGSKLQALISAPVVVGTIDHVMPATESARGGHQIAPMLRLLTSDLVLDEPDDFDLADQPALCRLVNWAGMLGSRVILSSATLPPALLESLFDAYRSGRQAFNLATIGREKSIVCGWVDEFRSSTDQVSDVTAFAACNRRFVDKRLSSISSRETSRRLARLVDVEPGDGSVPESIARTCLAEIESLHDKHHERSPDGRHRVSIGIVRMANINPLVQVARALAEAGSESFDLHLCVYHSRHPLYRRARIERELDDVLDRREPGALWKMPVIREALGRDRRDQVFVVLATAVAEVGRDHCYDWAIVEPSSMRSIVQLAGRVLRHRTDIVPREPNLVLLRRNVRALEGCSLAFTKPGYESVDMLLESHDLEDVLPPKHYASPGAMSRLKESSTPDPRRSLIDLEHLAMRIALDGDVDSHRSYPASLWWKAPVHWCYAHQARTRFRAGRPTVHYALVVSTVEDPPAFEMYTEGEWIGRDDDFRSTSVEPAGGVIPWPKSDDDTLLGQLFEEAEDDDEDARVATCRRYLGLSLDAPSRDVAVWTYHWWLGVYQEPRE